MKRTTYILIGMLIAGLVAIIGVIFYIPTLGSTWEDNSVEINGEQKTVQLPECRVVQFVIHTDEKDRGKTVAFENTSLLMQSTDAATGSFAYADGLDSYLSMKTSGDTLNIVFDLSANKLDDKFKDMRWINVRTAGMCLNIPESVQHVSVAAYVLKTTFKGFDRDTFSFNVQGAVSVEDCRINSLSACAESLNFNSGEVHDLYLNLDDIRRWDVETDSFHIDTEHLTGSREHRNTLQKGECRQVLWTPQSEKASLTLNLPEAAKIEIGE